VISPPRHQEHQDRPPIPICPQITQMTQILLGSGLPKPARSMSSCHSLVLYRRGAEAQRRREFTRIQRVARSWPPNGGQGPLERASFPDRREARRNRRAPGASAGRKPACDERSRSEQSGFLPVVGDRQIAGCSAVNLRHCRHSCLAIICVYLCDLWANCDGPGFAAERLRRGKRTALRLCVSASLRSFLCVSVSLWFSQCLGGSPGCVGGKFEIRNSKFEI